MLPPDSSLLPLAMLALRAATVSSGVGVEGSSVAAGFCAEALGMIEEWALARTPRGQRTILVVSVSVPQPSLVAMVVRV